MEETVHISRNWIQKNLERDTASVHSFRGAGRTRYPAVLLEQLKWTWGNRWKKCTAGKSLVTLMNVVLRVLGNILWWDAVRALAHKVASTAKNWWREGVGASTARPQGSSHESYRLKRFVPSPQEIRCVGIVVCGGFFPWVDPFWAFSSVRLNI